MIIAILILAIIVNGLIIVWATLNWIRSNEE